MSSEDCNNADFKRVVSIYSNKAIKIIRNNARKNAASNNEYIKNYCQEYNVSLSDLVEVLLNRKITVNFHPDRLCGNGKIILDSLYDDGKYYGQFITKTTNGGNTAYVGGQRFNWEQELFFHSYPQNYLDRPKYGALNILNYSDGAAPRFGSCYFSLNRDILNKCTFTYGDSSNKPQGLCTRDTFDEIVVKIIDDIRNNSRILNQITPSIQEGLAVLLHSSKRTFLGRSLDQYIETHIHSDINLKHDIDALYLDSSYLGTLIERKAQKLCEKYGIVIKTIPKREIQINDIQYLFRGEGIKPFAERLKMLLGQNDGLINAYIIGQAEQFNESDWEGIGNSSTIFQYMKQLWHTVAYFG